MASYDDDVDNWFDGLDFKVKKRLARAIKEQADKVADAIRAAAPVKSGNLRNSVKVRRKKSDLSLEVTVGDGTTVHGKRGPRGEANYAIFVEYGTKNMAAQPFAYSTYRAMQDEVNEAINDAIEEAISS